MSVKQTNEFVEARGPVMEAVTNFGGQPVWIAEPQWPISREIGKPMLSLAGVLRGRKNIK